MSFCTNHETCRRIQAMAGPSGAAKSAFALPYTNYYGQEMVVLLGKERGGAYQGQFNLIGGKGETTDKCKCCQKFCWIACLWREFREEGKITMNKNEFEKHFRSGITGKIRVIVHKRTPIFVGDFPGLSRGPLNTKIRADNANPLLTSDQKEMLEVQWVRMSDQMTRPDNGQALTVSPFAAAVIRKVSAVLNQL